MANESKVVLAVEIRVTERVVKNGADKGKKFMAFQIFNKRKGYYEELRFNSKVKELPEEEGNFTLEVERAEINRIGISNRKYPLTWISGIVSIKPLENAPSVDSGEDDLPF